MATVVERLGDLGDLLDELAAADLDTLSDGELDTLTIGLERARSRLALIAAIPLARWDARAVWVTDGSRNASCRLSRDTRSSINTARRQLVRAHHLADMAPTAAAILAGELSIDHFDLFALARSDREAHFARDEQTLVAECSKLRFGDAVQVVNYWKYRADAERTETEAAERAERNKLHAATTLGGTVVLNGELDAVSGAVVTNELDRLMRQIKFEDVQLGVGRTVTQRRAAALVEMARRSSGATGLSARPLFNVLIGDDTLSRLCELSNGTVVTPGSLVQWLPEAVVETVVFDGPRTVTSVSKRRTFVGAVRTAVKVRDRACQHPSGCDVTMDDCDVDHIVAHAAGGATSQFNGRLECPTHNRHADRHDHHATPDPPRQVTFLDDLRARLRWHHHRTETSGPDDGPAPA